MSDEGKPMTEEELVAIEARVAATPEGPWGRVEAQDGESFPDGSGYAGDWYETNTVVRLSASSDDDLVADCDNGAIADFVVAAPSDLRRLCAEVRRLQALKQSAALGRSGGDGDAARIVDAIIADLSDRRGLSGQWELLDDDIRDEIKAKWTRIAEGERRARSTAWRAPKRDESPALRAKIGAAIGVEAKRVYLAWDEPFLRGIEIAEVEQMGVHGLSAPQIVALRNVGLVPGESGWEVAGEL